LPWFLDAEQLPRCASRTGHSLEDTQADPQDSDYKIHNQQLIELKDASLSWGACSRIVVTGEDQPLRDEPTAVKDVASLKPLTALLGCYHECWCGL